MLPTYSIIFLVNYEYLNEQCRQCARGLPICNGANSQTPCLLHCPYHHRSFSSHLSALYHKSDPYCLANPALIKSRSWHSQSPVTVSPLSSPMAVQHQRRRPPPSTPPTTTRHPPPLHPYKISAASWSPQQPRCPSKSLPCTGVDAPHSSLGACNAIHDSIRLYICVTSQDMYWHCTLGRVLRDSCNCNLMIEHLHIEMRLCPKR